MLKVVISFLILAVVDLCMAGYFFFSCTYLFDGFTVGVAILIQIYAVLQLWRVDWFLDLGVKSQGVVNVLFILGSLIIYGNGFAWHTKLDKITPYGWCAPKSLSSQAMQAFVDR